MIKRKTAGGMLCFVSRILYLYTYNMLNETSLYSWLMLVMRVRWNTLELVGTHIFVNCFYMFLPFSIHLCGQFFLGHDEDNLD